MLGDSPYLGLLNTSFIWLKLKMGSSVQDRAGFFPVVRIYAHLPVTAGAGPTCRRQRPKAQAAALHLFTVERPSRPCAVFLAAVNTELRARPGCNYYLFVTNGPGCQEGKELRQQSPQAARGSSTRPAGRALCSMPGQPEPLRGYFHCEQQRGRCPPRPPHGRRDPSPRGNRCLGAPLQRLVLAMAAAAPPGPALPFPSRPCPGRHRPGNLCPGRPGGPAGRPRGAAPRPHPARPERVPAAAAPRAAARLPRAPSPFPPPASARAPAHARVMQRRRRAGCAGPAAPEPQGRAAQRAGPWGRRAAARRRRQQRRRRSGRAPPRPRPSAGAPVRAPRRLWVAAAAAAKSRLFRSPCRRRRRRRVGFLRAVPLPLPPAVGAAAAAARIPEPWLCESSTWRPQQPWAPH